MMYNSRQPRPGEVDGADYHFRPKEEIERLGKRKQIFTLAVRDDLQGIDLTEIRKTLAAHNAFIEGSTLFMRHLLDTIDDKIECHSVFLSPLCAEEIRYIKDAQTGPTVSEVVTDLMRGKLLRRTTRQKTHTSLADLKNIEQRASTAYEELAEAWRFDSVIANHDGEDSENWDAFYHPIGDALKSLSAFAALLRGEPHALIERWDQDLIA